MNLANLIHRLQESGLTQAEIAAAVGCSQSTISDMSNEKIGKSRPSYKVANGLIALAEKQALRSTKKTKGNRRHRRAADK